MTDFANLHGVIIGLGSIGNRHLQNLIQLGVGKLTVVRRPRSQNQQFQVPESVAISSSLEEMLAQQPDFAVICNPSNQHVQTAIQCLEAGCPVLIEKPLSASLGEEERELQALVDRSGKVAAMAYCMRYHPAYRQAQRQIEAGAIGRVLYAKAWFEGYLPDWHPWEDYRTSYAARRDLAGGALRTLDHELDFLNWSLGPAEEVQGWTINTDALELEADDLAMYHLRHPGGALSQVTTSFCRKPASRGFEFVGTTGTLSFRMEEGKLLQAMHESSEVPEVLEDHGEYDINQMYVDLASGFLEAVQRGSPSSELATVAAGMHCAALFSQVDCEQTKVKANGRT